MASTGLSVIETGSAIALNSPIAGKSVRWSMAYVRASEGRLPYDLAVLTVSLNGAMLGRLRSCRSAVCLS